MEQKRRSAPISNTRPAVEGRKCHNCGRVGHLAKECRVKKKVEDKVEVKVTEAKEEEVNEVSDEQREPVVEEADYLNDVEEAYWMDVEYDLEDVFGIDFGPSAEAAEKRKAMIKEQNRIVRAKLMPSTATNALSAPKT